MQNHPQNIKNSNNKKFKLQQNLVKRNDCLCYIKTLMLFKSCFPPVYLFLFVLMWS